MLIYSTQQIAARETPSRTLTQVWWWMHVELTKKKRNMELKPCVCLTAREIFNIEKTKSI